MTIEKWQSLIINKYNLNIESIIKRYSNRESIMDIAASIPMCRKKLSKLLKSFGIEIKKRPPARIPNIGTKIGMLTIVSNLGIDDKNKTIMNCICDCGKNISIRAYVFLSKRVYSCGCSKQYKKMDKNSNWKGYGELSGSFFAIMKDNAKSRHSRMIKWSLTIEYLWDLFLKQNRKCALSGVELTFGSHSADWKGTTASVDRIDSLKDYSEDNVQWVHKDVNRMKQAFDQQYFIEMCNKISENNK